MSNILKAAMRGVFPSGDTAEAIDLDGTNDYLSRASDLTGNTDGKTFTFSAWVWVNGDQTNDSNLVLVNGVPGASGLYAVVENAGGFTFTAKNSANTTILNISVTTNTQFKKGTFFHLLLSVDLTNAANRSVYINDVAATVTWPTYTNDNIDFTRTSHYVGGYSGSEFKGRLSNVFLAYEYIDLSVENNRRIFITADRKPA